MTIPKGELKQVTFTRNMKRAERGNGGTEKEILVKGT